MAEDKEKVEQKDEQPKAEEAPKKEEQPKAGKAAEKDEQPKAEEKPEADAALEAAAIMGDDSAAEVPAAKKGRSKGGRVPPTGIAHIRSTFNNTTVCITDMRGGVVSWSSAGKAGFKGSRKSTAFAATMVGQDAARTASAKGMHEVEVRVQGAGAGRESAIRAIQSAGLMVSVIKDITPIPHNGCRPRKRRRV